MRFINRKICYNASSIQTQHIKYVLLSVSELHRIGISQCGDVRGLYRRLGFSPYPEVMNLV